MPDPKPRFLAPIGKPRDYVDRPELAVRDEPECIGPAILEATRGQQAASSTSSTRSTSRRRSSSGRCSTLTTACETSRGERSTRT
jgi:hypothetical protein